MRINVGTKNPTKLGAVKETVKEYKLLRKAEVQGIEVASDVSEQPKSLEETVSGAMTRARRAFKSCDYSIGIESGLMKVPHTKTGSMDVSVCAIYDGKRYHLGMSCAFEFPPKIVKMIHELGIDSNEAFYRAGLTKDPKIGYSEGIISLLTKGRVTRKAYTKQAVQMALIHMENPELY